VDSYIIYTGIDALNEPNSLVIVMERIEVSLSQIINYKRKNILDWTVGEFQKLTLDLV
jgi:hypothetical protein